VTDCYVANSAGEDFSVVVPKLLQTLVVERPTDTGALNLDLNGVSEIQVFGGYRRILIEHRYETDPGGTYPSYGLRSENLERIEIRHGARTSIELVVDIKPPLSTVNLNSDGVVLNLGVVANLDSVAQLEVKETAEVRFLRIDVKIEVYPPSEATKATLQEWASRATSGAVELRVETNDAVSIEEWREHFDANIFELSERRLQ